MPDWSAKEKMWYNNNKRVTFCPSYKEIRKKNT